MDNLTKIPYLIVRFKNELAPYEVPALRGAIIGKVPPEMTLFHNHVDDRFRYRYPLIQYKRIDGKAAIVCVGEGAEDIGQLFASRDFALRISGREEQLEVESVVACQWLLQVWEQEMRYTLRKWLPLSVSNYGAYRQLDGIVERTEMLERILTGNILSLCTGLGVHLEKRVSCKILKLENERTYRYKDVNLQGMDVTFSTNISLADFIGLGKGVSIGHGVVKKIREHRQNNE